MRNHRKYERVDNTRITVNCPCMTPRQIMDMLSADIDPNIKSRKAMYGQGSEQYPIPRTMSIDRFSRMAERPNSPLVPPVIPTNQEEITE